MRPPSLRNFAPWEATASRHITDDATPPAKTSLLVAADQAVLDVATTPYCGCGRLFEGGTSGLETRYLALVVAPGSSHATAALSTSRNDTQTAAEDHQLTTTFGGVAGADIITVLSTDERDHDFFPNDDLHFAQRITSDYFVAAPAATVERALELEQLLIPKIEPSSVSYVCGLSICVRQVEDLETL